LVIVVDSISFQLPIAQLPISGARSSERAQRQPVQAEQIVPEIASVPQLDGQARVALGELEAELLVPMRLHADERTRGRLDGADLQDGVCVEGVVDGALYERLLDDYAQK